MPPRKGVTERDVIEFNIAGTVVDGSATALRGLSDIKLVKVAGQWLLVVAAEADSAITTYALDSSGVPVRVDSQNYHAASGTRTVWRLNFAQAGDDFLVLPATRYEDQTSLFGLDSSGTLSAPATSGISGEGMGLSETVTIGGAVYVFAQRYGGQGLTAYSLNTAGLLSPVQTVQDTHRVALGDISALAHLHIGAHSYLFVTSAYDAGLTSYEITPLGELVQVETVAPADGSGFSRPQALVAVGFEGTNYVIMASAGSSSLTVYQVGSMGKLTELDHEIDNLETRFQGASSLAEFQYDGRQFIVAAGSDDGISVFELWPDGTLHHEGSLADTYDITLNNVSAMSVDIINGVPVLFVSSATDHGFTRIELVISASYREIRGGFAEDTLTGTTGGDKIFGEAGGDQLDGGAGDDWLEDGTGADTLTGGAGADVFAFVPDGDADVITDFDPSQDIIDFSKFHGVNRFEDLRIASGCAGVLIYAAGEFLRLEVEHGAFDDLDLSAGHFVF